MRSGNETVRPLSGMTEFHEGFKKRFRLNRNIPGRYAPISGWFCECNLSTFPWNRCPPSAWITVHFAWNTHHFSGTLPLIKMGESFHRVSMLSNKYLGNLYSTMSLGQNHVSISPGWRQGPAISRGFKNWFDFRWALFGRAPHPLG